MITCKSAEVVKYLLHPPHTFSIVRCVHILLYEIDNILVGTLISKSSFFMSICRLLYFNAFVPSDFLPLHKLHQFETISHHTMFPARHI